MKLDPFVIITGSFCGFEVELRHKGGRRELKHGRPSPVLLEIPGDVALEGFLGSVVTR